MNWTQSIRHDRWTYWRYLIAACFPLFILVYGLIQQVEAYHLIRRGLHTLRSAATAPERFSPAIDPAMQRLEWVSTSHVVMMVIEVICFLFVLGQALNIMLQRDTLYAPRTTLLQVWAASVFPTLTFYLVTEIAINQTNDGSSGWLTGALATAGISSIWLYTKLKNQDELEQTEVVSPPIEKRTESRTK